LAQWLVLIVLASAIATAIAPGHRSVTIGAGVMALLAVLLAEMMRIAYRLAGPPDSAWERVRHVPSTKVERPADLERIERRLGWGQYSTGDFNYRVRPMLRRLAAHRLRESHRIDLDGHAEAARAVVTAELWDHVIAKQTSDGDRVLRTADVARMVDEIEGL
jgi:hypothetical protein